MKRRRFLLAIGVASGSALTGCLGGDSETSPNGETSNESPSGESSNESPDPPESCDPTLQEITLPGEERLNENDIDFYIKSVERQRFRNEVSPYEEASSSLSVKAISSYGEGFLVDVAAHGSGKIPDYTVAVNLHRTAPENVTVESAQSDPFAAIESLQEAMDTAQERLSGEHCRGRVGSDVSSSELDQLRTAFEGMDSDEDDWYYLQSDACYISVNFDESRLAVGLVEEAPGGVSVEPVTAERFEMRLLQDTIDEALAMSDDIRNRASSSLTEAEYDQLNTAFEEMEPDDDGRYYLQHNEWYAAVSVRKVEMYIDMAPWVARYYVDAEQVRVSIDNEIEGASYVTDISDYDIENANFDDPAESRVIIC